MIDYDELGHEDRKTFIVINFMDKDSKKEKFDTEFVRILKFKLKIL